MKLLDLSQPLFDGAPNCPAHPPVRIRTENHSDGGPGSWQIEFFDFASHTGSHVDAPRHKIADGATVDALDVNQFAGAAFITDGRGIEAETELDAAWLSQKLPTEAELRDAIVLIATGWGDRRALSEEWLHRSPFVSLEGARWLVERGVRGVGIDHFSIGGSQEPRNAQTHEILLGAGIWVAEELRFPAEAFELSQPIPFLALPLHLRGASGAPCRPVLVVEN